MTHIEVLLENWKTTTRLLQPGIKRAFHDVLVLASEDKTTLIHGRDYRENYPCLVNTVGSMLSVGGGVGIPSRHFRDVVSLFDSINRYFDETGVNKKIGFVSPLSADILVRHYCDVKDITEYETQLYGEIPDVTMNVMMEFFMNPTGCSDDTTEMGAQAKHSDDEELDRVIVKYQQ